MQATGSLHFEPLSTLRVTYKLGMCSFWSAGSAKRQHMGSSLCDMVWSPSCYAMLVPSEHAAFAGTRLNQEHDLAQLSFQLNRHQGGGTDPVSMTHMDASFSSLRAWWLKRFVCSEGMETQGAPAQSVHGLRTLRRADGRSQSWGFPSRQDPRPLSCMPWCPPPPACVCVCVCVSACLCSCVSFFASPVIPSSSLDLDFGVRLELHTGEACLPVCPL